MKLSKIKYFVLALLLFSLRGPVTAQNSENGYKTPATGTVRALVVFAEVSYSAGCTYTTDPFGFNSNWLPGNLPTWANTLFDTDLTPGALPQKKMTDYYYQMSLGKYIVLGDYYPQVITVPCSTHTSYGVQSVISQLNSQTTPIVSNSGKNLNSFDLYSRTSNGAVKTTTPPFDNRVDMLIIIWRNNRYISSNCYSGAGLQDFPFFNTYNFPIQSSNPSDPNYNPNFKNGVDLVASYNACDEGGAFEITSSEYFHALMGGNNWHTASGAGYYTFLEPPANFSITGQSGSTSKQACGWDRFHLGWNGWLDLGRTVRKSNLISAMSTSNAELASDLTISSHPNGGQFVLRDFNVYGDAIRIKLPHLNWNSIGDIKNQYLWIENHQKLDTNQTGFSNRFDIIGNDPSSNTCTDATPPGMLTYIQVGKDQKTGSDIYLESPPYPNGVGSWLFPLPAEGRYDFVHRYDLKQSGASPAQCANWNNPNVPLDKSLSIPNPFTGFSDLFQILRTSPTNPDFSSIEPFIGNSEIVSNGTCHNSGLPATAPDWVCHNWYGHGDAKDAFNSGTGNMLLNMGTNPSTAPVYTYTSSGTRTYYTSSLQSFENRKVLLNGIQVKILQENYNPGIYGPGAILVEVDWDYYNIDNNARWCGNIHLLNDPNDPLARSAQINLMNNKNITLDQGKSPTRLNNGILQTDGSYHFADPTGLILESGTITSLQPNSELKVINGSSLGVKNGSTVKLYRDSKITVDALSHLCVENVSDIQFMDLTASITINGNTFYGSLSAANPSAINYQNIVLPSGVSYANSITTGPGISNSTSTQTVLKGVNFVLMEPGTEILPTTTANFIAIIQAASFSNDCSTISNFRQSASGPLDFGVDNGNVIHVHDGQDHNVNSPILPSPASAAVNVYPNPASNMAHVETSMDVKDVQLYDSKGKRLDPSLLVRLSNTQFHVSTDKIPSGIYFMRIITIDDKSESVSLIVNNRD